MDGFASGAVSLVRALLEGFPICLDSKRRDAVTCRTSGAQCERRVPGAQVPSSRGNTTSRAISCTAAATAASLYDYGTTYFGMAVITWIAATGPIVRSVIAVPITFGLEFMVSYALKGGKK